MPRFVARSSGPIPFPDVRVVGPYVAPRAGEVVLCYDLQEVSRGLAHAGQARAHLLAMVRCGHPTHAPRSCSRRAVAAR